MSLGILTNIAAIYAENNLNQTQASLQNTLTQLSSGSRINTGADDAAGLSVANGLQANVTALTQSSQNASQGIGLLQTADGALSQVTNLLNRAVTLATEAANGTLNSNQVSSANAEYQNILTEIGNIGSSTNYNGNSVFTSTAKTVFVSDGTASGANSYSETVGTLGANSVGESVGATVLSLPSPTTPTATTTVQAAVSVTTPTVSSINPTPVAASATASATTSLTPVETGDTTNTYSGTAIINGGVLAASGGSTYTASTVTAAPTTGTFGAGGTQDTYSGVIGVRLVGANPSNSTLYTASVAPGSSLQTLVTSLNNSFGYNPNVSSTSTSGLQASIVNNALSITTAPNTVGTVAIDAPTNSLQVSLAGTGALQNVSFGSTGGVTTTTAYTSTAQTSVSSTINLTATTGLTGELNVVVGGSTVGSVDFGAHGSATTNANIASTLATAFGTGTAFANAGYSYSYNSGTGDLKFTAPSTDTANAISFTTGVGNGAAGVLDTYDSGGPTYSAISTTPTATTTYSASSVTLGAAVPNAADTYKGTLTVQLAGSAQTYTASIATGSSLTQTLSALNAAFGSSVGNSNNVVGSIGSSGLVAIANGNAIQIESNAGAGQVVVDNASTLQVNPSGSGSYASAAVSGGGSVSTGYTATVAATAAAGNTATVALGTASVAGTLNIFAGTTAQGTALGSINFGDTTTSGRVGGTSTGTNSVQAAIAAAFTGTQTTNANANTVTFAGGASTSLAGYSATYNTSTGSLAITGPANGNSFSLGQTTNGSSELQTGSVSTTLTAGAGITVNAATLYSGTVTFGSSGSYVISSPSTASALATAGSGLVNAATAAGLTVANVNNQLVFTSSTSSGTAPTVTVTGGAASTEAYTASSVSFAPTNSTAGTYSGQFSIALGGTNYNTSFAAGTTGIQAAAILNGVSPGSAGSGVFGNSGLSAAFTNGQLTITGPTPSATSPVASNQITVNSTNDLSTAAASTQTLTNANAATGTTYTGTISFGATGTTAAGSYVIGSNGAGTTAASIAAALNASGVLGGLSSGITASVNSSNELVFSGPSTGTAQGSGPGVTLTNVTATAPTVTTYSASTAAFAANVGGTFSGNLTVGTASTGQIASTIAAGTTLANLVTQLNNQYTQAGVSSQLIASAGTGTQAGQLIISSATPTNSTQATADQLVFSQSAGANTLTATSATSVSGGPGAGVDFTASGLSQLTASTAQTILTSLTTAINDVAYQRGIVGADVNELTAASNVASSESVNLTSAQSNIQQTDYGQATSNLAKYQVLSQTGISALAQANSVQQEVLKLLQ
jgi:flagellin